jgi:hypothetical protein
LKHRDRDEGQNEPHRKARPPADEHSAAPGRRAHQHEAEQSGTDRMKAIYDRPDEEENADLHAVAHRHQRSVRLFRHV